MQVFGDNTMQTTLILSIFLCLIRIGIDSAQNAHDCVEFDTVLDSDIWTMTDWSGMFKASFLTSHLLLGMQYQRWLYVLLIILLFHHGYNSLRDMNRSLFNLLSTMSALNIWSPFYNPRIGCSTLQWDSEDQTLVFKKDGVTAKVWQL